MNAISQSVVAGMESTLRKTNKMSAPMVLFPGEEVSPEQLPKSKKGTLTLGPGLRHILPSTIVPTTAGSVHVDPKKSAIWLESPHGRYVPAVGDLVIAQIHRQSGELWHCSLTPHTPHVLLGQLSFEGANRKTRPNLKSGDVVYARISHVNKWEDTEIECFNSNTGRAEGMGPLKGGMVFSVSPAFARRLMMGADREGVSKGGVVILEEVGEKVKFEVAIGRNGKVWVDSENVQTTAMVGRLLITADDESWSVDVQRTMVKNALKDI